MSAADRNLIARLAANADADAFALLVDRHNAMVFAACRRILGNAADAEEAAQICFFRLLKNSAKLHGSVAAWLHAVAVRVSIDMIRRAGTRRAREKEAGLLRLDRERHDWAELRAAVDEEIAGLSRSRRAALVLHYLERRPQREIAEELGVTQPRVSQLVAEALKALRKALKRKGWTGPLAVLAAFMAEGAVEAAPATLTAALGKMAMAGVGGSASIGGASTAAGAAASATTAAGTAGGTGAIGGLGAMKITAIAVATAAAITIGAIGVHNALKAQPEPPPPPVEAPAIVQEEQVDPTLARARELCAQLRDRDKRKQAFAELFALQEELGNPVTIEHPLLGKGELVEELTRRGDQEAPPGYLYDRASGISAINHQIIVPLRFTQSMRQTCAFLLDQDGHIIFVGMGERVTALLDANRDGSLKFISVEGYIPPRLENAFTYRLYALRHGKVELEMKLLANRYHALKFGDEDGSQPAWLELSYTGDSLFGSHLWDSGKNAYVGPEGGPPYGYQVLDGKRFVAEPPQGIDYNTFERFRRSLLHLMAIGRSPEPGETEPPFEEVVAWMRKKHPSWENLLRFEWYLAAIQEKGDWIEGTADILSVLLKLRDQDVPTFSAFLLGKIRHKPSADALWAVASDTDRWHPTRACAIWALARIGDDTHVAEFQDFARWDESETVRAAAIYALALLAKDPATVAADEELPNPYNRKALDAALEFWERSTGLQPVDRPLNESF